MNQREAYTHGHHESVLRGHRRRTAEDSAEYLLPLLRPGMTVLDVGAGPGSITFDLARLVAPGQVRGVDTAADIVAAASALASQNGHTNLTFAVDDAYALQADDDAFDVVHAHQVLQHLSRPIDALREFRRVCADNGVVAVRDVDYEGVIWYPMIPALDEWLDLYLRMHRGVGGEPAAGRRLKAWTREAGFRDVTASASLWLFESPQDRAWWGGMWEDRALHSSFADHVITQGLADQAALERISSGWHQWAASEEGWLLLPHAEVLARH